MRSSTMFGIAMGSALANAQNRFCSSYSRPNWDDCQVVIEDFGFEGGDEILHENGRDDPAPSCKWWYREGGNCRITHCFEAEINDDPDDPRQRSGAQLFPFYEQIRSQCVPFRAGGEFTGAFEFLNVLNDEDESGNPPSRRTVRRGNGLVEGHLSLEEYREWLNDTLPAEAHREREDSQLLGARESKHAQLNEKRQDDEEWVDVKFEVVGTRNPNQFERGPRLGSGVGLKYESQSSTSFGVTSTVSLGASWDIFTASVGLEMSQTDTYTVTEGLTFDVDCPNQGQVTFWPYYDYFEVTFQPSGRDAEIWVPVEAGNKEISGEITVACVG